MHRHLGRTRRAQPHPLPPYPPIGGRNYAEGGYRVHFGKLKQILEKLNSNFFKFDRKREERIFLFEKLWKVQMKAEKIFRGGLKRHRFILFF